MKGKYVYEKEIEGFQKELIKELIKKNNNLKNEVKTLKTTNNIYRKSEWDNIIGTLFFSIIRNILIVFWK